MAILGGERCVQMSVICVSRAMRPAFPRKIHHHQLNRGASEGRRQTRTTEFAEPLARVFHVTDEVASHVVQTLLVMLHGKVEPDLALPSFPTTERRHFRYGARKSRAIAAYHPYVTTSRLTMSSLSHSWRGILVLRVNGPPSAKA